MAALHIVGENLELRLVVHRGVLRKEERRRHHLAVGLLCVRAHDDLALEDAIRALVDRRLEELAALTAGHRMVDDERHIRMAIAVQHPDAVEVELRPLPGKAREDLMTRHQGSEDEIEAEHGSAASERQAEAREREGLVAFGVDANMLNAR